jgi:hypothetical protein
MLVFQGDTTWAAPLLPASFATSPDYATDGRQLTDGSEFIAPATISRHDHYQRDRSIRACGNLGRSESDLIEKVWDLFW